MFRKALFWLHLVAGLGAALVVVIMSVTGVALTYQRQMQAWADRGTWRPASLTAPKLSIEQIYARLRDQEPDSTPTTITVRSGAGDLVTAALAGGRTGNVLVDPYTGDIVPNGPYADSMRRFFSTMVLWHRYVGATGEQRAAGKAITGASNLAFLFLVLSGIYLWWPRRWTWASVRSVVWFRGGLPGRARDFNWHHVLGFWSAIPLAIVVASGVVISYPWAGNLVYRIAGEAPPVPAGGRGGGAGGGPRASAAPSVDVSGVDRVVARAAVHVEGWRSLAIRLPATPRAPVLVAVDEGDGGQPQKRGVLTLDRATAEVVSWEPFSSQTPGRRLRSILRFAHTGEVLGMTGQTIAGLVSAASVVLAYTGIALAWRRLSAWRRRRGRVSDPSASSASEVRRDVA